MASSGHLAKLAIALHYSVPPVLALLLVYVSVVDKTFELFRLLKTRLPACIVNSLRLVYVVGNAMLVLALCGVVLVRCNMFQDSGGAFNTQTKFRLDDTPTCLPSLTMATLLSMCALWFDRIAVSFFELPSFGHLGFGSRTLKATILSCAFMALATNDSYVILLLLVNASNRPSGLIGPSRLKRFFTNLFYAIRLYALSLGLFALVGNAPDSVSRRSTAVVILGALSNIRVGKAHMKHK